VRSPVAFALAAGLREARQRVTRAAAVAVCRWPCRRQLPTPTGRRGTTNVADPASHTKAAIAIRVLCSSVREEPKEGHSLFKGYEG